MRKIVLLWIAAALTAGLTACGKAERTEAEAESVPDVKSYCAYVISLGTDTIEVDIAEYITTEDTDRMRELNLTEADMPDGYYIHNPDETTETLYLTKDTNYTFIDWGRDFVDTDIFEDLLISTTSRELFHSYLKTYTDSKPGMPFFMEVEDGTVKSILEKPFM